MINQEESLRVLLVEDHEFFREYLKGVLYQYYPKAVVAEAEDGKSALRLFGIFKPHLVCVDINLPGEMNGLKLTEQLRSTGTTAQIAIFTSHDLPEYRSAATQIGADFFVPKSSLTPLEVRRIMDLAGAHR